MASSELYCLHSAERGSVSTRVSSSSVSSCGTAVQTGRTYHVLGVRYKQCDEESARLRQLCFR